MNLSYLVANTKCAWQTNTIRKIDAFFFTIKYHISCPPLITFSCPCWDTFLFLKPYLVLICVFLKNEADLITTRDSIHYTINEQFSSDLLWIYWRFATDSHVKFVKKTPGPFTYLHWSRCYYMLVQVTVQRSWSILLKSTGTKLQQNRTCGPWTYCKIFGCTVCGPLGVRELKTEYQSSYGGNYKTCFISLFSFSFLQILGYFQLLNIVLLRCWHDLSVAAPIDSKGDQMDLANTFVKPKLH